MHATTVESLQMEVFAQFPRFQDILPPGLQSPLNVQRLVSRMAVSPPLWHVWTKEPLCPCQDTVSATIHFEENSAHFLLSSLSSGRNATVF